MDRSKRLGNLTGYFMYLTFAITFNLYLGNKNGILFVAAIWGVFKAIEYFFSGSKLSFIVKLVTVLAILYRTGVYGSFLSPMWIYNCFNQVSLEIQHFFLGNFDKVVVAPTVLNLLLFVLFKEVIIESRVKRWFLYIILFAGGSLLLFVNIWKGSDYQLLVAVYLGMGLIKIFFSNMEQSNLIPRSSKFTVSMGLSILMVTFIIWNISVPVTLAHELEAIKIRLQGGYTPVESGGSGVEGRSVWLSGYSSSSNDNMLGGAVELSYRPTLTVESPIPIYLRGESRYLYTGSGWSGDTLTRETVPMENIPVTTYPGVTYEEIKIKVEVVSRMYQVVFSGLNTKEVKTDRGSSLTLANGNDLLLNFNLRVGDSYEVVVLNPTYTVEALRESGTYRNNFPLDAYTSLPDTFPTHIKDLAMEITSPYDNHYDKAMAIRNYLTSNEFRYSLDVGYPDEGMDFVEHFLREKQGYCVHYSTAFVVMARSVGIPARWVKGFTQGSETSQGVYTIADRNAHAWGEIYLPNAGWVMFEATPGFQTSQGSGGQITNPQNPGEEPLPQDDPNNPNPINPTPEPGSGADNQPVGDVGYRFNAKHFAALFLVIALLSVPIIKKKSKKILTPQEKVIRLYNKVTGKFKLLGIGKQIGETPREYMNRLKPIEKIPSNSLSSLTQSFEYVYYGGHTLQDKEFNDLKESQNKYPFIWLTYNKVIKMIKK